MAWLAVKSTETEVELNGQPVKLTCTRRALSGLDARTGPLIMELEIVLGCMVRKDVHFYESVDAGDQLIEPGLGIRMNVHMINACDASAGGGVAGVAGAASGATPKWLRLDYRKGNWVGEFGL